MGLGGRDHQIAVGAMCEFAYDEWGWGVQGKNEKGMVCARM